MASREALEQEKAYHYECIRGINTRLNALVPISRIPPELLSEVFLHTAGHRADPASHPPPLRDWIRVTHVCRHWRETALQCTALWSRVDAPINIKWLAELLARSKDSPLSMKLSFRPVRVPGTGQFISSEDEVLLALSALHRVRTLTVDTLGKPMKTVLERLGGRALLLESLTITGASKSAGIAKFRASISRMLSHPDSRRLHTVVTYFCCIPWRNLSCATEQVAVGSLTRLVVHGSGDPSELSVSSFFKALACMPRLEELELAYIFRRHGYPRRHISITSPDPITLLRLCTSGESTGITATLLSNLHTPYLSHLSITV
ncbi:hypothetical protein C8Q72DRAFT_435816 [Fomitopsis betulina]|nr:hypothetical protein C8Q72DRAFT_435816 [Fomitopsis betulina]